MKHLCFYLAIILVACSCKKNNHPEYDKNKKSEFTIEFDNVKAAEDLELNTSYQSAANEEFTINSFRYVVSNIVLTASDNSTYSVPQQNGKYLIDESDEESTEINLEVPESEYKILTFDVTYLEMLGTSTTLSPGAFSYTAGNLTTPANSKSITLDLSAGGVAKVKTGHHSEVHLLIDVFNYFAGFLIAGSPTYSSDNFDAVPASNLWMMIKHDHTHNN